ncbi:MAG: competence protein ComEA [Armatimonadota bacterium]|nr:MAG: competence protein ComEA [Armatimonadota bacterium]
MERVPKGLWTVGALVAVTCGIVLWQGMFSGSDVPAPTAVIGDTRQQSPPALSTPAPPPATGDAVPSQQTPPADSDEIVVHVAGAVKKPGLVRIPRGSRVDDAVRAAGGFSSQADPDSVNLAQPLEDGVQVYVPRKGEAAQVEGRVGPAWQGEVPRRKEAPSGKININTASAEQLESLPGVGPATARAIIEYRKQNGGFSSIDELLDVRGIGPKKLEQIRPYVTVR